MRSFAIYPASLAAMNQVVAGSKYRPSNGTEGELFMSGWCYQCARDRVLSAGALVDQCADDERCDIWKHTMVCQTEDPEYPTEWQYGPDGQPRCVAFVEVGQPIPHQDEHTIDLFPNEPAMTGHQP